MNFEPTVFIVDDDAAVREAMSWLVSTLQYPVEVFESAADFLEHYTPERPGCVLLDVRLPGMSGMQLQRKLLDDGAIIPVIIITGHGDVPMAVRAIQTGAFNFLEKPFRDQELLDNIQEAIELDATKRSNRSYTEKIRALIESLTPRERELMQLMVDGYSNRGISEACGISVKTVEVHRSRIMSKMGVGSLPELVKMALIVNPEAATHD